MEIQIPNESTIHLINRVCLINNLTEIRDRVVNQYANHIAAPTEQIIISLTKEDVFELMQVSKADYPQLYKLLLPYHRGNTLTGLEDL